MPTADPWAVYTEGLITKLRSMSSLSANLARSGVAEPDRVRRMLEAAPHRGTQLDTRTIGACALGVSRRDDDDHAGVSSGERLVAAFSGLLDNGPELRGALIGAGAQPRGNAQADLVEAAWETWGERAPARMRGQFAAAVSDGERIWCFRDQVGFRAVYHRTDDSGVFFASEAKQVLAGAGVAREADLDAVEAILFGYGGGPQASCSLRGVRRMNAASVVTADRDGLSPERLYWHPERLIESGRDTPDEARERFAELFGQAVSRCLTGQDAISLSGGIDSTAVAAFAAPGHEERFGSPVSALSAVFPDLPGVDETRWIEMVVEYLKMPLHTYRPHSKSLDDVERWCGLLDAPTPVVSVPELDENYALAAQLGHRSLLTGELAEYVVANSGHLAGHLLTHGRITALSQLLRTQRERGARLPFMTKQFIPALVPGRVANAYLRARGVERAVPPPDWIIRPDIRHTPRPDLMHPIRGRWIALQTAAFGGASETLAADEVVASMHGVDVRRPFVDVDLWEFFLSLRAEVKFPDTRRKTLVKSCLRGRLPDAILDRKDKTVFGEHLLTHADYDLIGRYVIDPPHRFDGVDYARLAERIEQRDFTLWEFCWARDLTSVHAFLAQL
jgi:asparagine synthase (glutamine-hydrolysing)